MSKLKIFYFDVETMGLHSGKDYIHQISGIIEIDGVEKETFNIKMQPEGLKDYPDNYVSPVGGITKAMMLTYGTQAEGFKELKRIMSKYVDRFAKLDKFTISGYNCQQFDMAFLRIFFERNGDTYFGAWFYSASIDVMIIAAYVLRNDRHKLANFKLETVAKYLGIQVDGEGYHDALADVRVTRDILSRLELY